MTIRLARGIEFDSIVDGDGLRTVIWTQGCSHNCAGCHNPQTHSFKDGFLQDIESVKQEILENTTNGVTLTGGDPMFQIKQSLEIAKFCQNNGLNVWCYTGFTFEKLLEMTDKNSDLLELLNNIDILIDGQFIESLKNFELKYRGSSNQRVIECKNSINSKKIIHHDLKKDKIYTRYQKNDYIYI